MHFLNHFVKVLAVLFLILIGMSGCLFTDLANGNLPEIEVVQSNVKRDTAPDVSETNLATLINGNSAFAFDLYQILQAQESGNFFYSPYSLSQALAMTYAGARGETEIQMAKTLHFELEQDLLHPTLNALELILISRNEDPDVEDGDAFQLHNANSLWGQSGYLFLDAFLDILAENYAAGMRLLDFETVPEQCRLMINRWVSDQTQQKIENLIPQGLITQDTRLVLTNAIYFNASWKQPFNEESTQERAFHLLDGSQVSVPMMHQGDALNYAEGDDYRAVELPYVGEKLSMVVVMPDVGEFENFERALDADLIDDIFSNLHEQQIALTMPRFSFEASFLLKQVLAQMGMPIAFSGDADFSGMDGTGGLTIGEVIHKAYVSVDEAGTEAAAATAVIMIRAAMGIELSLDHPFIFMIRDIETNAVLFVGRVLNPQ